MDRIFLRNIFWIEMDSISGEQLAEGLWMMSTFKGGKAVGSSEFWAKSK